MPDHLHFPLLIAKSNKKSPQSLAITSPFDDRTIATVDIADHDAINLALATAHTLSSDRKNWLAISQRLAILNNAITIIESRAEELALGASLEGGKPLIDSRIEIARCINSLHCCVETLRNESPQQIPMQINNISLHRSATSKKEPIGVVVAISAFNHPLNLIAHQIGPAIATGCPVIIKPAEETPLSCYRLVKIFHEAGLPIEWCQALVCNDTTVSEQLATDPRVAFFSFIGSAKVGWYLRSKLAAGTRCALEHGGVAPVILAADTDLSIAIPSLTKGGFYHAGQVCVSVQRIFVHESIAHDVAQQMSDAAKTLIVGDPLSDKTEVGPLIRQSEVDRIDTWVQEAIAEGAQLLSGGKILENHCYDPTVLYNPSINSKVSNSEIFGPVVCIYPFANLDSAISRANSLDFAFQASVYSQNIDTAMHISNQLDASAVMINEHTAFRVDWMPFAGLKHSGLGIGGIPYTMDDMQISKMIVITSQKGL